jgi:hypothetical protein
MAVRVIDWPEVDGIMIKQSGYDGDFAIAFDKMLRKPHYRLCAGYLAAVPVAFKKGPRFISIAAVFFAGESHLQHGPAFKASGDLMKGYNVRVFISPSLHPVINNIQCMVPVKSEFFTGKVFDTGELHPKEKTDPMPVAFHCVYN